MRTPFLTESIKIAGMAFNRNSRKAFPAVVEIVQQVYCSVLLTFLLCYFTGYWYLDILHDRHPNRNDFRPSSDFIKQLPRTLPPDIGGQGRGESVKTILLWTEYFGSKTWYLSSAILANCSIRNCRFTSDKSELDSSHALAMNTKDMSYNKLPTRKLDHQIWIFYTSEPPLYNDFLPLFNSLSRYNGLFNWTMTFRQDSDARSAVYGNAVTWKPKRLDFFQTQQVRKNIKVIIASKTKLVAARISNCFAFMTNRVPYINRLRKYIPVDFFGRCGDRVCPGYCDEMSTYKFYLSFENSRCRDYITEKFERPLFKWRSVPVVMGGAHPDDYKKVAPPHSYINVDDFASVQDLANYLIYLDQNTDKYEEYFNWHYTFDHVRISPWCSVCEYLHNTSKPAQVYSDLEGWFLEDLCHYGMDRYLITTILCITAVLVGVFIAVRVLRYVYRRRTFHFRIFLLILTLPCINLLLFKEDPRSIPGLIRV